MPIIRLSTFSQPQRHIIMTIHGVVKGVPTFQMRKLSLWEVGKLVHGHTSDPGWFNSSMQNFTRMFLSKEFSNSHEILQEKVSFRPNHPIINNWNNLLVRKFVRKQQNHTVLNFSLSLWFHGLNRNSSCFHTTVIRKNVRATKQTSWGRIPPLSLLLHHSLCLLLEVLACNPDALVFSAEGGSRISNLPSMHTESAAHWLCAGARRGVDRGRGRGALPTWSFPL